MVNWSLAEYCSGQEPIDWSLFPPSTQSFVADLGLPSVNPFCRKDAPPFSIDDIPPIGPLDDRFENQSTMEAAYTVWKMIAPALLAMSELWIRLFAGLLAPIGVIYFIHQELLHMTTSGTKKGDSTNTLMENIICIISVASSLVLMTDTLYVLEYGPQYGISLFALSLGLAFRSCRRNKLVRASMALLLIVILSANLIWDNETKSFTFGGRVDDVHFDEGLYHDSSNTFVHKMVQEHWPEKYRTYGPQDDVTAATPWMPTGDSRTGLPFLLNRVSKPDWKRFFLQTLEEEEYLALDIAFPKDGHDPLQPMYMVLHGLNGGSDEEYIRDFTERRTAEGSTVAVMVARGLMDLPIRGWNNFHGARTIDAHAAAMALQKVKGPSQVLVGVGYSMGAIVLSNYVASSGSDCRLDAAMAVSGGLDMRFQEQFYRAQRLWQPMLAENLRDVFLLGKWGKRVRERLSPDEMLTLMRASHITQIDRSAVVAYNRFDDLDHYYRDMSALGDIPRKLVAASDGHTAMTLVEEDAQGAKIHSVSIPFCVVHALDDPLITWRTVVSNEGFMRPESLVKSGSGNLLLLLTKGGGHVGWPVGWLPHVHKWKWMSDLASSFALAVHETKKQTILETPTKDPEEARPISSNPVDSEQSTTLSTDQADAKESATVSDDAEEASAVSADESVESLSLSKDSEESTPMS